MQGSAKLSDKKAEAYEQPSVTRALTLGFATVAIVAILVNLLLMFLLVRVGQELSAVREDARSVQAGLGLSLSVREHYLHESHTVIQGDDGQLHRHRTWLVELRAEVERLSPRVPQGERARLSHLLRASESLDRVFQRRVVPAALASDHERLRRAHGEAQRLTDVAVRDADAVVAALNARMERSQRRAREASTLALATGSLGALMVILLAALFVRRLRDRERRRVASERMAAIGQLAAGVAHEINNPIGVIRGYLKTMIAEPNLGPVDPEGAGEGEEEIAVPREELLILDEEAAACQHIVEDLLAYARAPSLDRRPTRMAALLREEAERFGSHPGPHHSSSAGEGRVSIRVQAEEALLVIDPLRLRQVVRNLLSNAAQATAAIARLGGLGAPIELRGERLEGGGYRVLVEDRGPGLAEEEREGAFEPFRSGRAEGTGLGLSVCRAIAHAHGGEVRAEAREGGGARFVVDLPPSP